MSEKLRIMVPIDGSDASFRALAFGAQMAQAFGAVLDVVTVLDVQHVDPFEGYGLNDAQFESLQVKLRDETLGRARRETAEIGPEVETRLLRGPALKTLLHEAEQEGVVAIVVGRTGKGVFERMVEGSVSRGLSAHCDRPVVSVP